MIYSLCLKQKKNTVSANLLKCTKTNEMTFTKLSALCDNVKLVLVVFVYRSHQLLCREASLQMQSSFFGYASLNKLET